MSAPLLLMMLQMVQSDSIAPIAADKVAPLSFRIVARCQPGRNADEVIVCGRQPERYRLPLPVEREPVADASPAPAQSGMTALTPAGRCGLFAGERRCGKREAAAYGYGRGRDPVTVLTRLARKVADGD